MQTDDLLDEIFHSTVGLPREERLVAALRVLHGAALESPYPSSGAWASLLAELIAVACEGEQALLQEPVDVEHITDMTVREISADFGTLTRVKDERGIAFIITEDEEDAARLTRYIRRYWKA